jgi:cysteine desulfurase
MGATTLTSAQTAASRGWADPSGLHHAARTSGQLLDAARASIAQVLGVRPEHTFFAASGSAALQAAITGVLRARGPASRLVLSAVESLVVFDLADQHVAAGGTVTVLPVDAVGRISLDDVDDVLAGGDVAAVCVQSANPETGTRQPTQGVFERCRAAGVPLIVDARQTIGHDPVPSGWDLLVADARDWAGPAGLGVLLTTANAPWLAPAGSARGWLNGAPDVTAAVTAATALEMLSPLSVEQADHHRQLIDHLRSTIATTIEDVDLVGDPIDRLPHVLTFSVLYVAGEAIVTELDKRGFAVASGSACVVDTERASHVLAAMGALTSGNVRITLPYNVSQETIDGFLAALPDVVAAVREEI